MEFPKRIKNHVKETLSFKILQNSLPDKWVVRELTERDYGIDCYIEPVNDDNQIIGELISIQLKATESIQWSKDGEYKFHNIKISTTNYWNNFPAPTFLCLVDLSKEEVYFCPVKSYVRENYDAYFRQKNFPYTIKKKKC